MKKIDFEKDCNTDYMPEVIKNIGKTVKTLKGEEEYELYFGKTFLGKAERKGKKLELKLNGTPRASAKWTELEIFDSILRNAPAEKINIEYDGILHKKRIEYDTGKAEANFIFHVPNVNPAYNSVQAQNNERELLVESFVEERQDIWEGAYYSEFVKTRKIECVAESGNKIVSAERKATPNMIDWQVEKFVIDFSENKFEYEKGKNNDTSNLKSSDAVYLYEFCNENTDDFSKIVNKKYDQFLNETLKELDYYGFELAEFKPEMAADIFQGIRAYENINYNYPLDEWIATQSLDNALAVASEFSNRLVTDNSTGIKLLNVKEDNVEPLLNITLKEKSGLSEFLECYETLKSKKEFEKFLDGKVKKIGRAHV